MNKIHFSMQYNTISGNSFLCDYNDMGYIPLVNSDNLLKLWGRLNLSNHVTIRNKLWTSFEHYEV